jgi:Arc/MetJ-type ribon-helix-helix transcriptional regulator
MNVSLPKDLADYVESLLRGGNYSGTNDVIQEALRQHKVNRPGFEGVMTPELESLLDEGLEDLEHTETTDGLRRR